MKKETVLKILLFFGTLLFCLFFLELLAQNNLLPFYPDRLINTDGWWKERWLREKSSFNSACTASPIDRYDSTLGYRLRENLTNVLVGDGSIVNSNSLGIRGKAEYSFNKSGKKRILSFGTSFTFGECVNDNETYSYFLDSLCPLCEVLNMGVHGYAWDQELLYLELEGPKYHPDIVILGFFSGSADGSKERLTFRDYFKPRYRETKDGIILDTSYIISPDKYREEFRLRSLNYFDMIKSLLFPETQSMNLSYYLLNEFVDTTRALNATSVFVYLPTKKEIYENLTPSFFYLETCINKNIICINPIPELHTFIKERNDTKNHFECHYSPEIHRVIAEKINEELKELI